MIYFSTILFCFFSYYYSAKFGLKYNFVDIPIERKLHKNLIPYTGGLGISLFLIFSTLVTDIQDRALINLMIYSQLVILIGLYDDKKMLMPMTKIVLLLFPTIIMVLSGLNIDYLGTYKFIGYVDLGPYTYIFTALCCLILINAVNYSDGIDGLASALFISSILLLYAYIKFSGINSVKLDEFIYFLRLLLISVFIFTFFNHNLFGLPKLFLGDSGSLFLGFFLSFTLIYVYKMGLHPSLIIWSICIYIFDFLSTNIIRIIFKKKIFLPAYDHLHHQVLKKTKKLIYTNLIIVGLNFLFGIIGLAVYEMKLYSMSIILYIILFLIFFYWKLNTYKNLKED